MKKGDRAFFYHSGDEKEIVGIVEMMREAYPDPTAQGRAVGRGRRQSRRAAAEAGDARRDQGRAEAQGHGAGEIFAAVGAAGHRRGMEARLQDGRAEVGEAPMMQPQNWIAILARRRRRPGSLAPSITALLGKAWLAAQGKTMAKLHGRARQASPRVANAAPFVLSFVAEVVMGVALLRHPVSYRPCAGSRQASSPARSIWFGFVLTTIAVNNAYTGRSSKLTAIDAGHWLGVLLIIGARGRLAGR